MNEVPELNAAPKPVELPQILSHFVGPEDTYIEQDNSSSAPDNDYIVGGTGIAKALSYCLSHKATDLRRVSQPGSGANTPSRSRAEYLEEPSKAIQPALIREARSGNDLGYRKFLRSSTLLERLLTHLQAACYSLTRLCKV
jgi:hypothetical protein